MKPTPPGWPRISSGVWYEDPAKAIDWLCAAFGFEVRLRIEGDDGSIMHSELVFGEGVIMVAGPKKNPSPTDSFRQSPRALGGANTQNMMIYVDDVEAHCKRAREAGAKIVSELTTTDYGEDYWSDRGYLAEDIDGHHWWFFQRLRDPVVK
ncbi:MAG: VOC family protein [Acidobacteriota bacterium]